MHRRHPFLHLISGLVGRSTFWDLERMGYPSHRPVRLSVCLSLFLRCAFFHLYFCRCDFYLHVHPLPFRRRSPPDGSFLLTSGVPGPSARVIFLPPSQCSRTHLPNLYDPPYTPQFTDIISHYLPSSSFFFFFLQSIIYFSRCCIVVKLSNSKFSYLALFTHGLLSICYKEKNI